jgi:hypothetical protein
VRTFISYSFKFAVFYFGINWLADNPQVIGTVRDMTNGLVSVAMSAIGSAVAA